MTSLLDGKWRPETFQPKAQVRVLELMWRNLKDQLDEEKVKMYKKHLRKFLLGHIGFNHFEDIVKQFIPSALLIASEEFVRHFSSTCLIDEFDDFDYEATGVSNSKAAHLPGAANLNALLLLECVDRGFEFPNVDCATEFTRVVRQSIANTIEAAVCTTKGAKTANHGFIRSLWPHDTKKQENQPCNRLLPRDFLDSVLLSDNSCNLFSRLEKNKSLTNFYYNMLKLSYPDLGEKNSK